MIDGSQIYASGDQLHVSLLAYTLPKLSHLTVNKEKIYSVK